MRSDPQEILKRRESTNSGGGAPGNQCREEKPRLVIRVGFRSRANGERRSKLPRVEERVKLNVMGTKEEDLHLCGPRVLAQMNPEKQPHNAIRNAVTTAQRHETNQRSSSTLPSVGGPQRSTPRSVRRHAKVDLSFGRFCEKNKNKHVKNLMRTLMRTPFFILRPMVSCDWSAASSTQQQMLRWWQLLQ